MYLSILNTFRVIRCLNKCVSVKIAIFTTFLFPWGDALVIIMLNVILMKKWIGNGRTPSACAYAYTLRGNRTWRAMSATSTDWWLWDENKLWTVLAYSCKRAHITELYCRGTDWRQSLVDYKSSVVDSRPFLWGRLSWKLLQCVQYDAERVYTILDWLNMM